MSNLSKTISYLKRNGLKNTCYEVCERLDRKHVEEIQKKAAAYKGSRYFFDEKVKLMYAGGDELRHGRIEDIPPKPDFKKDYLFSILVPAYETNPKHLEEMMESVIAQSRFAKVELIIADAGTSLHVEHVVKEYEKRLKLAKEQLAFIEGEKGKEEQFPRIKYIRLKENKGISENTNAALLLAEGDYIGLLDHDDTLSYDALFHVRQKLEEEEYELLYSDEDKGNGELTEFFQPHFKPDFNLDYLLSNNYICHFLVMKADLMKSLGFRREYDGAQDYDLVLRAAGELLRKKDGREKIAHIPKVLYHWRCHESSTASNPESKRYAYEAGKRAVEDFLKTYMAMGKSRVSVKHTSHLGFYKVSYRQSVFQARPEVAAVCGRVIRKGKVVDGPVWKLGTGELSLFTGLKASYGGYMHRAEMTMQVDSMPKEAVIWNEKYQAIFKKMEKEGRSLNFLEKQQYAKEQGDIFLYVPDFAKMRQKLNEDLI